MRKALGFGFWLTVAVACGGNSVHHLTDGGTDAPREIDAGKTDAAPDASTSGAVTLALTVGGVPTAGSIVYFQNADSSLVAELQTGSDGNATQVMMAGGFVTLIEPVVPDDDGPQPDVTGTPIIPNGTQLDTFAAVQPGDVLHIDLDTVGTTGSVTFPITVPTDGSADDYELFTSCEEQEVDLDNDDGEDVVTTPTNENITLDGCEGVADMLLVTFDVNGNPLNTLYSPGITVDGAPVVLTGSYAAMSSQSIVDLNVPAGFEPSMFHALYGPHGQLAQLPNNSVTTQGTIALITYEQPPAPLLSEFEQAFFSENDDALDFQVFGDWGSASTASVIDDATAERLPDLQTVPTFDVTGEQLQWQVSGGGSGVTVDVIATDVEFERTIVAAADAGGDKLATWEWDIVAPGTEDGALGFPVLPTDVFAWNGSAGDDIDFDGLEMANVPGGYDAVRANGITVGFDDGFDTELIPATPSGHLVLEIFDQEEGDVARAVRKPTRHHPVRAWRGHRQLESSRSAR